MQNPAMFLQKPRQAEQSLAMVVPSLELEHLWFRLTARNQPASLVLVPAETGVSTLTMTQSLAALAAEQPASRVLVVNASLRDCLPPRGPGGADVGLDDFRAYTVEGVRPNCDFIDLSGLHVDDGEHALALAPQLLDAMLAEGKHYTTALFSVDSLLFQTRAIPLVRSLDAAVLCFSLGRTTFAAARQLVELAGRDKVLGAVALR